MDPFKPYQPRPKADPAERTSAEAEAVALQGVAWIIGDDDRRNRFMAITGCGADELRDRLTQPAFLGGVLDFLLADEPSLLAFCEQAGFPPDLPMQARMRLP